MRKPSYLSNALFVTGALVAAASCTKDNSVYCDDQHACADQTVCAVDTNVCVDSTFALDRTKFFDDGVILWTIDAQPTLRGTGAETNATVEASIDGTVVATTMAGLDGTWQLTLPAGAVKAAAVTLTLQTKTPDGTVQIATQFALDAVAPNIEIVPVTTLDENGDEVTFASNGEPIHTHTNVPVVLDGTHCADIVKYGYLLDTDAPKYGTENARNNVAWDIKGEAGVALRDKDTRFRIINKTGGTIVDWQPLNLTRSGAAFTAHIPITRQLAPQFGAGDDSYTIEWELVDWAGRTAKASGCWNMHVLAAPLRTTLPKLSTHGPASFGNWLLPNVPPISGAIDGHAPGAYFESVITNATLEPVEFEASVFAPRVKVTKTARIADFDIVVGPPLVDGYPCPPRSTLQECNATQPAGNTLIETVVEALDTAANHVVWKVELLDDANQPVGVCTDTTVVGTVRCRMPGRVVDAAPVTGRLVASMVSFADLNPGTGPVAERDYQGFGYTGPAPRAITHCAVPVTGSVCRRTVSWQQHTMLAHAVISAGSTSGFGTFAGAGFRFAVAPGAGPTSLPASGNLITARPIVWDSGAL